jgi:hypothetical protein
MDVMISVTPADLGLISYCQPLIVNGNVTKIKRMTLC